MIKRDERLLEIQTVLKCLADVRNMSNKEIDGPFKDMEFLLLEIQNAITTIRKIKMYLQIDHKDDAMQTIKEFLDGSTCN
jgi:hypothetical protein